MTQRRRERCAVLRLFFLGEEGDEGALAFSLLPLGDLMMDLDPEYIVQTTKHKHNNNKQSASLYYDLH